MWMNELKQLIGKNLKLLREHHQRSRTAFARDCGMAQPVYSRLENAEVMQHLESLEKIANRYGLEAWQLLINGFDPSNPPVLQPITPAQREFYEKMKELSKLIKQ